MLCDKEAITTVAHILVCAEHEKEYQEEGCKYLPFSQRPFYQRLLAAQREKERVARKEGCAI